MPEPHASTPGFLRFRNIELDVRAGALRHNGKSITLPEQPLQILTALLERPGDLVTREELRQRLWQAETYVDFEHGLNAAVKRLRDALGDSADTPQYIETVPRRGYRFVAPLDGPVAVAPASGSNARRHDGGVVPTAREVAAPGRRGEMTILLAAAGISAIVARAGGSHARALRPAMRGLPHQHQPRAP